MEWFSVPELPSIFESHTSHLTQDRLPLIYPSFTLPPLGDKPNDPIISHLLNKPRLTEKSVEVTPRVPANNRANGQDEVDSWSEDAERHAVRIMPPVLARHPYRLNFAGTCDMERFILSRRHK